METSCIYFLQCTVIDCTQDGDTALTLAAYGGRVEMARMLLDECGSTVNEVDNVSMVFTTLPGAVGHD